MSVLVCAEQSLGEKLLGGPEARDGPPHGGVRESAQTTVSGLLQGAKAGLRSVGEAREPLTPVQPCPAPKRSPASRDRTGGGRLACVPQTVSGGARGPG